MVFPLRKIAPDSTLSITAFAEKTRFYAQANTASASIRNTAKIAQEIAKIAFRFILSPSLINTMPQHLPPIFFSQSLRTF
jgi:hypothetical protein